jgi:dipeptidyl aminopeptidase/acylaminoacyl peptidase
MNNDPYTGFANIWVYEISTGKATQITKEIQPINSPVWSRDGKQIAYASFKDSYSTVYRKAADGTGEAEAVFRYTPGAGVGLSDWSPDGKFLRSYGVLLMIRCRIRRSRPTEALEWLCEDYEASPGSLLTERISHFCRTQDVRTYRLRAAV